MCTYSTALFKQKTPNDRVAETVGTDFQKPSQADTIVLGHNDEVQADLAAAVVLGVIRGEDDAVGARVLTAAGSWRRVKQRLLSKPAPKPVLNHQLSS